MSDGVRLSAAGVRRREQLRADLIGAVVRRRRVRKSVRGLAAALVVVAIGWIGWPDPSAAPKSDEVPSIAAGTPTRSRIEYVRDDEDILERCAVDASQLGRVQIIQADDELLAHLERAGYTTGIVRVGDELMLTAALGE